MVIPVDETILIPFTEFLLFLPMWCCKVKFGDTKVMLSQLAARTLFSVANQIQDKFYLIKLSRALLN